MVVRDPYNPGESADMGLIATFADPDDNYFQLMSPMDMGHVLGLQPVVGRVPQRTLDDFAGEEATRVPDA